MARSLRSRRASQTRSNSEASAVGASTWALRSDTMAPTARSRASMPAPVTAETAKNGRPSAMARSRSRSTASEVPGMSDLLATTTWGRSASSAPWRASSSLMTS